MEPKAWSKVVPVQRRHCRLQGGVVTMVGDRPGSNAIRRFETRDKRMQAAARGHIPCLRGGLRNVSRYPKNSSPCVAV